MFSVLSSIVLSALSAPAPGAVQPSDNDSRPIIVIGQRIQDYRDRLATCLARNCPPDQDIDATTALAEALFLHGDYEAARASLRASIGRNRDEASRYPEPVSDLYRSNARVTRHLGLDDESRRSLRQTLRSLQTGLPTEDHRHFTARMELADSYFRYHQYDLARDELNDLAMLARKTGREDVAVTAELWRLWIDYSEFPAGSAMKRVASLAQSHDPRLSIGAKALLIRIHSHRGETERADALIVELGRTGQHRQLLYSPSFQLLQQEDSFGAQARLAAVRGGGRGATANLADRLTDTFDDAWIDIAFRIRADGSVDDVQVLRRGPGSKGWEAPLTKSIKGRRYSAVSDNHETFKIERYSYTSELQRGSSVTGSHIPDRSPKARVERLELSSIDIPS